jgi:hypothetical protein
MGATTWKHDDKPLGITADCEDSYKSKNGKEFYISFVRF